MMLNAEDWGGVVPPPAGAPAGAAPGFGSPPAGPLAASPGAPGFVAAPAAAAPAAGARFNPMVLFFAGLAITFVVGSCLVGIVLALVL
ncbi:MAG: hypothetical protein AB8I08_18735 [Sandaracinaceae bacterium]